MLSPGRYLKPILGGDTEGTGKAVVIEVINFDGRLWYRDGSSATLYDLEKHQLDESKLIPECFARRVTETDFNVEHDFDCPPYPTGTAGHQAEDDLLFPERLEMIKLIAEIESQLFAYETVRGTDDLLTPLKLNAAQLQRLSKSYLEVPHQA